MIADLLLVLAGALLCNAIPHLAAGLRGEPFPSPFATPSGIGHSSPVVNFLWGSGNLFAGIALLATHLPLGVRGIVAAAIGFLAIGVFCARHFGTVRQGGKRQPPDRGVSSDGR
jgi:hypothetical protein